MAARMPNGSAMYSLMAWLLARGLASWGWTLLNAGILAMTFLCSLADLNFFGESVARFFAGRQYLVANVAIDLTRQWLYVQATAALDESSQYVEISYHYDDSCFWRCWWAAHTTQASARLVSFCSSFRRHQFHDSRVYEYYTTCRCRMIAFTSSINAPWSMSNCQSSVLYVAVSNSFHRQSTTL